MIIMKKIAMIILSGLIWCALCQISVAQQKPEKVEIKKQLMYLLNYAVEYDKFAQLSDKYKQQKNEARQRYVDMIKQIKHGPNREKIENFLNKATGIDSIQYRDKKGYSYTYSHSLHIPRISKMPTLLEYYKVVKYSLFDMDRDELLPPKDIPFLRYKEW